MPGNVWLFGGAISSIELFAALWDSRVSFDGLMFVALVTTPAHMCASDTVYVCGYC